MSMRRVGVTLCWAATATLLSIALARVVSQESGMAPLPTVGQKLSPDSVTNLLRVSPSQDRELWVLVLTSGCHFCLGLDAELDTLRDAAHRRGAELVPVVIPMGPSPDSILDSLRRHHLDGFKLLDPSALVTFRVRQVPAVLGLTRTGEVTFVSSPIWPETWPLPPSRLWARSDH